MRRMVAVDKEFLKGHRCSECAWFRQTSKSTNQDAKQVFQAHDCSKFPLPYTNRKLMMTLLAKRMNGIPREMQESSTAKV
jgi:hypothetical protein